MRGGGAGSAEGVSKVLQWPLLGKQWLENQHGGFCQKINK